jgi:hypothetical protein
MIYFPLRQGRNFLAFKKNFSKDLEFINGM